MNILVENASMKLWVDAYAPIVFCKLLVVPDDRNKFLQLCKNNIVAIEHIIARGQNVVYSICDATEIIPFHFEVFMGHYMHHLPSLFKAGLKFQAVIKPAKTPLDSWTNSFGKNMDNKSINIFDCFEKALDNINKKCTTFSLKDTEV